MTPNKKRGIVLMNLGSPDSTSHPDVKKYLKEFLMDERVIDYPYIWRSLLVKGLIVPFRTPKSAEAYSTIWWEGGSPLVVLTKQLQEKVQEQLEEPVVIAMRYGNPSPEAAFEELLEREPEVEEVILFPLYPHYAMASYETAVEYAKKIYKKKNYHFKLLSVVPYYSEPAYIRALSDSIAPYLQEDYDHLLFSYHGIPQRHIRKSDVTGTHCLSVENCCEIASPAHNVCYRHQVYDTTKAVVKQLDIPKEKYSLSFQSRLGKGWLEPFTDFRLKEFPAEGVKKLLVVCPAFVSDCLETLEEIAIRGKASFLESGGESFKMIPCMNTQPKWIEAISSWLQEYAKGDQKLVMTA